MTIAYQKNKKFINRLGYTPLKCTKQVGQKCKAKAFVKGKDINVLKNGPTEDICNPNLWEIKAHSKPCEHTCTKIITDGRVLPNKCVFPCYSLIKVYQTKTSSRTNVFFPVTV